MPFFETAEVAQRPIAPTLPQCGSCGLFEGCLSPKMPVTGEGRRRVLIVAEAPGAEEDRRNEQLVGAAGQELRRILRSIDIDLDVDCWKTNSLICRPPDNRAPTNDEIDYCRPNLTNAIKELEPVVVIPMGAAATRSVLGPFWREDVGSIGTWAGWKIPLQAVNMWVVPTWHPSYIMREREDKSAIADVLKLWFKRHLEWAFELSPRRPWDTVPDLASKIEIELHPESAARWIRSIIERGGATAFDYETNMLKPDSDEAEIVSCSICWRGLETLAYPMVGEAVQATVEYLKSKLPKLGANNKFETRWSRAKLGTDVTGWVWDSMDSAHHLDPRSNITSVKFQGFARLGQEPWDLKVRPYLIAEGGNTKNRIRDLDRKTLLQYNGMDSLVEFHVGRLQRAEMHGEPSDPIRRSIVSL